MKKSMLALLLPVTAGVALAGTGFGVWVFTNNAGSDMAGADLALTAATQVKDVTVYNGDSAGKNADGYTFDQSYYDTTEKAYKDPSDLLDCFTVKTPFIRDNGYVEVADKNSSTRTTSISYSDNTGTGLDNVTDKDAYANQICYDITVNLTGSFTLEEAIGTAYRAGENHDITEFFHIAALTLNSDSDGSLGTVTYGTNDAKATTTVSTHSYDANSMAYYTLQLEWVNEDTTHNGKPMTYEEYVLLKTVLKHTSLTVTVDNYNVINKLTDNTVIK